ncbi:hypothetical protein ACFWNT_43465 [Streptomyces sp. NPDC058409]|uniref:hypothetical protein n=1 Tax=Streptomyces sp. NPDC058409 TaxID=3346484 RepID=UPI00365A13B2
MTSYVGREKHVDHEVTRFEVPPEDDGFSAEKLTGTEANIRIRGLVVNSMADELWTYEAPDLDGNPLRIVARTVRPGAFSGPRVVREVYVQAMTGGQVHELDWLEREEYELPVPTRQPVKVGDRVTAMPDGYSLEAGLATKIEWTLHPMQAHYALPPLWHWEWRVTVWFGGTQTREGKWADHWVSRADDSLPGTRDAFEPTWRRLEAECKERQSAE